MGKAGSRTRREQCPSLVLSHDALRDGCMGNAAARCWANLRGVGPGEDVLEPPQADFLLWLSAHGRCASNCNCFLYKQEVKFRTSALARGWMTWVFGEALLGGASLRGREGATRECWAARDRAMTSRLPRPPRAEYPQPLRRTLRFECDCSATGLNKLRRSAGGKDAQQGREH